ncbi:MAG TPA: endo alpha-1,4 polygalactosaminidase [Polyangia bacterium]|nr:endo alpha-1,4 polygalactosaminidase [Polyangia bacterium]
MNNRVVVALAFLACAWSCGGSSAPSSSSGGGTTGGGAGATASGGTTGSGGATANGGATASGGTTGSGGVTATGGTTGGTTGSGGATGTAGTTGAGGAAAVWHPAPGTTWQWQLSGNIDTTVDAKVYDIDLFTNDASVIKSLHDAGRSVICYFSAGSYEPDRPDSAALAMTGLGKTLDGWPDEKWVDTRVAAVRDIMKARLDVAVAKKCDGVEPDNVDGYDNDNGLGLTKANQIDYDTFLATEAHARGLSVGLKNALGLVTSLVGDFDWALNEECLKYAECDSLAPFVTAKKAVFHCEYATSKTGICDEDPAGFSTIIKHLSLDAYRLTCP